MLTSLKVKINYSLKSMPPFIEGKFLKTLELTLYMKIYFIFHPDCMTFVPSVWSRAPV